MDSWDLPSENNWEREGGQFQLPPAEFAKLLRAVAAADKKRRAEVAGLAKQFRKGLSDHERNDPLAYFDAAIAVVEWASARNPGLARELRYSILGEQDLDEAARTGIHPPKVGRRFWQPKRTDFKVGEVGDIHFDEATSVVHWGVYGTPGAANEACSSPVGSAFFDGLSQVQWDQHTGGSLWSNSSGRSDGESAGPPSFFIGPQGAAETRSVNVEYIHPKDFRGNGFQALSRGHQNVPFRAPDAQPTGLQGQQGRVQRGIPTGGQFTAQAHDESDLDLDGKP